VVATQPTFADTSPHAEILTGTVSASQGMLQRHDLAPKDPVAPVKQAIEQSGGHHDCRPLPFPCRLAALLVTDNEETEMVAFRFGRVVFVERTALISNQFIARRHAKGA
jgi:hypothetical protein